MCGRAGAAAPRPAWWLLAALAAPAPAAATTLAAARFAGGVVLGADSRATEGTLVADAACDKLHPLAENCWAGGCGTAADADAVARRVALDLRFQRLAETATAAVAPRAARCRVAAAAGGLRARCRAAPLGCGFLLGGVDAAGAALYRVEPDGATTPHAFTAMGSGQMAAVASLEASRLAPTASRAAAVDAVRAAVEAGARRRAAKGRGRRGGGGGRGWRGRQRRDARPSALPAAEAALRAGPRRHGLGRLRGPRRRRGCGHGAASRRRAASVGRERRARRCVA